ncbi:Histone acetyltransferase subunit NuA4-domain-containing protein [Citrus sinensis]|uniref:Histone acetyltransferase subunit NuA4-domain-containing protein n=1 Tax=Citrus sinensis TaxID=2711 RepID=A0ACB8MJ30_CITSI|nr:Histone acetyltransferase subunit NuA4-domain-containing protein [Citrus sinensis]KAH9785434.1 Histone acetyltransferase subunit NuA4-domain-containing protein [Citrus sinensis]
MDPEGQRASAASASAVMASLLSKKAKLQEELNNIEKQLTFSLICIGVVRVQAEEQAIGREDGRSDFGPGRSKGGGIYGNGQGKPKKGRGASRDAKRYRHSSEDFDYDDDPDVTL